MQKTTSTPDKQIIGKSDFHHPMMEVGLQSKRVWTFARLTPALLFLFAIPTKADAFVGEGIVRNLLWAFLWLVSKLLWIAQSIFTYSLTISTSFSDKLTVIEVGWKVARDATNIFFIIILLIMSIGTILRLQNYNAKRLLVNLVLMAILINFSLAIGSVVIDFSNVLGLQFLTAIHPEFKVSDVIMENLQVTDMFKSDIGSTARTDLGDLSTYATIVMGNAILMVVLVFVFFVSGIMMFIRLAMLMLLLVVAPIAFVLYILPDTKSQFDKWWKTLIDYSFFFPAYAFLLYVSVKMIIELNKIVAETTTTLNLKSGGFGSVPQNLNFISNVNLLVGYAIACVFLIASLMMGKSMSLYGANAVIGLAKTGRKYLTGAVASGALYPARFATRRIAESETVQRLKDRLQESRFIPKGLGAAASRGIDAMLQRGAVIGQMRPKSAEQTADFLAKQDNDSILKAWGGLSYMQKMAVLRKLPKDRRDKLMEQLPEDQKQLALRMSRGFEGEGRAGELEAAKWQSIKASSEPDAYEKSMEYFSKMSRAGKERALRTMDQKEQADYIGKLRAAHLTDAADQSEDIIRTEFTQQQRAAYEVAGFQRLSADEQLNKIGTLSNQAASGFLYGKTPEERMAFVDKLRQKSEKLTQQSLVPGTPPEEALRLQAEAQRFVDEANRVDKAMRDYFSPEDLRKHNVAIFNTFKEPAKMVFAWGGLSREEQEEAVRARNDQQQAALTGALDEAALAGTLDPSESARAKQMMRSILAPAQYAKYKATAFLRLPQADQNAKFGDDQELGDGDALIADLAREEIIRRKKTVNEQAVYVASLNQAGKDAAERVIETTLAVSEVADYKAARIHLLPPDQQAAAFDTANEAVKEAFIRSLSGERRAGFLKTLTVTQRLGANRIIKARISVDEQSEIVAEEFFFETEEDKKRELFKNADMLAREKILAKFKEDSDRERFIADMERSGNADLEKLAADARKIQFSGRFTATQVTNMKKAAYGNYATLAENAGMLVDSFYVPPVGYKQKALSLENMTERQQIEIFEATKKNAAYVEQLYGVVHSMKPHLRDQYLTRIISRGSAKAIDAYFGFADSKIGEASGRGDTQREQELREEKGRIFQSLAPEAKARLWISAWQNQANDRGRSFGHIKEFVDRLSDNDKQSYRERFAGVLGEINHADPEKAWEIFTALDEQTRTTMLQAPGGKGVKVALAVQDRRYEQLFETDPNAAELVVSQVQQAFDKAGVSGYRKPKPPKENGSGAPPGGRSPRGGGGVDTGTTRGGPTISPMAEMAQKEYEEQKRRAHVTDVNKKIQQVVSSVMLDDVAIQETIGQIRTIDVSALSPEGRTELAANAGSLVARLQNEGKTTQAAEIVKALNIEGAGAGPAVGPALRQTLGERQPTFRGGPVRTQTPSVTRQTAPQTQPTFRGGPATPQAAPAPGTRREKQETVSPAVQAIIDQPFAAAAAQKITTLRNEEIKQFVQAASPDRITEILDLDDASIAPETKTRIVSQLRTSEQLSRFSVAQGISGRNNEFLQMTQDDRKVLFEAIASIPNPEQRGRQLENFREATWQLPETERNKVLENVIAEGSQTARQEYLKQVQKEKTAGPPAERQPAYRARLTQEEQAATSKKPIRVATQAATAPRVDAIKPNGKQEKAIIVSPAVKKIVEIINQPAQAAVEYKKLNQQEVKEFVQKYPEHIIALRDEAPAEMQAKIVNDIKSSSPAQQFRAPAVQEGQDPREARKETISAMIQKGDSSIKTILEAVADEPIHLTQLRSAVHRLPQDQQKQFYENVLAEASLPARQQYAQHIRAEKEQAVRENRTSDVERLTREEQVIVSKRPLVRQQTQQSFAAGQATPQTPPTPAPSRPTVDGIKPNGKKSTAAPSPAPQSFAAGQRAASAKPSQRPEVGPTRITQRAPQQTMEQKPAPQTTPQSPSPVKASAGDFGRQATSRAGKIVEKSSAVKSEGVGAQEEEVLASAIDKFKEKLRKAKSKEDFEALLKEVSAYLDGLRSFRQKQLEQGLAEISFEVQNTNRSITEVELLIEEIKKQLAKFSS